jgi:hypothetical protein
MKFIRFVPHRFSKQDIDGGSLMTQSLKLSRLIILLLPIIFVACGQAKQKLSDDPQNEPLATTPVGATPVVTPPVTTPPTASTPSDTDQVLAKYDYIDPNHEIRTEILKNAILYFDAHKSDFPNNQVISVLDFKLNSSQKRWHFINMQTGTVWSIRVAHGKGSDPDHDGFAQTFSNISGSDASSLGVYRTAETYQGGHGYSLRLDGLSSTNSNVRAREIVVHGADYVQDKDVIQGRSWGCPAVSMANYKTVIDLIKSGSMIYASN